MTTWSVCTNTYPMPERKAVWRKALDQLAMPSVSVASGERAFHGEIESVTTPLGMEFARLAASPLEISGKSADQPYALWLAFLIEGDFSIRYRGEEIPIPAGNIVYAPTGVGMSMSTRSDFSALYIRIPKSILHTQLLNPATLDVGWLPCSEGVNRVFCDMLLSLTRHLMDIDPQSLRPIEISLSEFLIANLVHVSGVKEFGNTARVLHFRRIVRYLDANLADGDLSLAEVADVHNVSERYVQKLFEATGMNFLEYVRTRRLERCKCELSNPEYNHLSVSDICFRWGFNDAAHFSRTFRKAFGMPPRDFRRTALQRAS